MPKYSLIGVADVSHVQTVFRKGDWVVVINPTAADMLNWLGAKGHIVRIEFQRKGDTKYWVRPEGGPPEFFYWNELDIDEEKYARD